MFVHRGSYTLLEFLCIIEFIKRVGEKDKMRDFADAGHVPTTINKTCIIMHYRLLHCFD